MNPYTHAKISANKRGGRPEDYLAIHSFLDSTKELCSDNRHRLLHNLWGVRRIVIPIFGSVITNSVGKQVNVKDVCEQDHLLPDYANRFIPTLDDFVQSFGAITNEEKEWFNRVHRDFGFSAEVKELLLSPLAITGSLKALRITHNSWFLGSIVPRVFGSAPILETYDYTAADLFADMEFAAWMDNGVTLAPSTRKLAPVL